MSENNEQPPELSGTEAATENEAVLRAEELNDVPAAANEEAVSEKRPLPPALPVARQLALLSLVLIGVFALGSWTLISGKLESRRAEQLATPVFKDEVPKTKQEAGDPFANISIGAASAIVIDLKTGEVLYEKAAAEKRPLASITKLMTALVAHEVVAEGLVVPISKEAISQAGDSSLREGERFTLGKLSDLSLLTSSNDGAFALAAAAGRTLDESAPAEAFVKAMNIRAKEIGLSDTSFRNPTGLDITTSEAGAYGSARDVAALLKYILENQPVILEETTKAEADFNDLSGDRHTATNTNPVVDAIPGLIASKTGYTTLAGGNLAVLFDAGMNHPIAVVVLASSHSGRFTDVLRLIEAARAEINIEN